MIMKRWVTGRARARHDAEMRCDAEMRVLAAALVGQLTTKMWYTVFALLSIVLGGKLCYIFFGLVS